MIEYIKYCTELQVCVISSYCIVVYVVNMTDVQAQEHYDNFFEEVFTEIEDKVRIRYMFT